MGEKEGRILNIILLLCLRKGKPELVNFLYLFNTQIKLSFLLLTLSQFLLQRISHSCTLIEQIKIRIRRDWIKIVGYKLQRLSLHKSDL